MSMVKSHQHPFQSVPRCPNPPHPPPTGAEAVNHHCPKWCSVITRSGPCPGAPSPVLGHPLPLLYGIVSTTSTQVPGLLSTWHCARCEGHRSRGHGRVTTKEEWHTDRTSISSVSGASPLESGASQPAWPSSLSPAAL